MRAPHSWLLFCRSEGSEAAENGGRGEREAELESGEGRAWERYAISRPSASAHASLFFLSLPCSSLAFLGNCFSLPSLLLPVCNYTGANYPPSIARGRFPIQILDIVLRLRVFLLPMLCAQLLLHLKLGISNSGLAI